MPHKVSTEKRTEDVKTQLAENAVLAQKRHEQIQRNEQLSEELNVNAKGFQDVSGSIKKNNEETGIISCTSPANIVIILFVLLLQAVIVV